MKNRSLTKITAFALLVTMIALVIISGTFAKYTTEYNAEGTAIVAKWNITAKDLSGNVLTKTSEFNLFDVSKVYDLDGVTDLTTSTGVDDADVANGTTEAKVAPGTWGKIGFVVTVGADNDVTLTYGINITKLETTLPLQFSTDGTTWQSKDDITKSLISDKEITPTGTEQTATYTLYWKWDYEKGTDDSEKAANDTTDTTLGTAGTADCKIEAKLVATQKD